MKHYYIFLCLLFFCANGFTQDNIVLKNDSILKVEIVKAYNKSVVYYRSDGEGRETQIIHNPEISKIIYKSGFEDIYHVPYVIDQLSLKEIKEILLNEINLYCFHEDSDKKPYNIEFEKDLMRFKVVNGHGVLGRGILFDFSEVYKFYKVSERTNTRAYINIMVKYLKNKRNNIWHKRKLIMRVKGHQNAYRITSILKRYNKLVSDQ